MHLEFLSQSSSRLRRSAEFVFGVRQEQTPQPGKELCCPDCQHQIQPDRRGSSPPSPYAMDRDHHRGKEAKSTDKALITFLWAEPPHIPQCHSSHRCSGFPRFVCYHNHLLHVCGLQPQTYQAQRPLQLCGWRCFTSAETQGLQEESVHRQNEENAAASQ